MMYRVCELTTIEREKKREKGKGKGKIKGKRKKGKRSMLEHKLGISSDIYCC